MKLHLEFVKGGVCYIPMFLAIGTIMLLACTQKTKNPRSPKNLRCEYQAAPLGIDVLKPSLSWIVNDSRRGAVQTAYQVLIAGSKENLQQEQGDMWDSGKIESDQSIHVPYSGKALESGKRYFWKVRTWDSEGQTSPYSATAWWEMGLLNPEDWQAQWVGKLEERPKVEQWPWGDWIWHPTEIGINKDVYFRKQFNLPTEKQIQEAQIKTTADNNFTLYLNEEEIGEGKTHAKLYKFDGKPFLRPGDNLIAIRAANAAGDICGLVFSLKITFTDGSDFFVNSDKSWRTKSKSESGWATLSFKDKKWGKAKVIEHYGGHIWGKFDHVYIAPRSIIVRNEFNLAKKIKSARAYATGLGCYMMFLNGQRVGQDYFTPGWTDYPTKVQYQTYDVTSLVKSGENAVGAILGNVWWSGGLGWRGSEVYSEGPLRFFMQLVIDYDDGTSETIVTDKNWKTVNSPILENTIYHGETYDAGMEQKGWDQENFDDSAWEPVTVLEPETKTLVAQQGPTLQVTEEINPVQITEPDSGTFVFDLGQNMVGWARLKVRGPEGTKVRMRFAEILKEDGNIYTENLRGARATDTYILKGEGTEIWQPHFTYHGFRYVEVTGYPGKPGKDAITGRVFHSAAPVIGHFNCSNEIINKVQKNITWGQRGNMHSVPTDCPQRDERLGWMGDAQIFAPTASFNMNMARFFTKWQRDIVDCQDEDGAVHDVNPAIVVGGPAKPGWGDAVVVIPWVVYQYYGDKRIIEESYDGMAAWVQYMEDNSKGYLYEKKGYGDWIAVVESPTEPIGAAYFYYDAVLMSKMAAVIGKDEDALKYQALAEKIATAFNKKYFDKHTFQYQGATQTANLLPVAFGMTSEEFVDSVVQNIVNDIKDRDNHLSTGFLGTYYILPILSHFGYHGLAYELASQTTYPSWGYMVEKGATTIWELWNSDTEGPRMNSRNHFALGSVGEWFYGWLGGIRPDPQQPGFKRTIVAPKPVGDLTWAEASFESPYGLVSTKWEKKDVTLKLKVSIPANTSALVHVPTLGKESPTISEGSQVLLDAGKPSTTDKDIKFIKLEKDAAIFSVGAGDYEFHVTE